MFTLFAILITMIGIAFVTQIPRLIRAYQSFDLVPNCLLTREPIVFLQSKKSLFYFFKYWNGIPHFLKEHGYEVYEISPRWIGKFESRKIKPHWIVDDTCTEDVKNILSKSGSSLHKIQRNSPPKAVLQHAIRLAESEQ